MDTPTKRCYKCGKTKPVEQFYPIKNASDGRHSLCRECSVTPRFLEWERLREQKLKRCSACKQVLPHSEFSNRSRSRDGLCSVCRDCAKIRNKTSREKHIDAARENQRQYYAVNKETEKEKQKAYRQRNAEKERERVRQWRLNNPELSRQGAKKWINSHKTEAKAIQIRRRARKNGLPDNFTAEQWRSCLDYWHSCCAYCGNQQGFWTDMKLSADHWIPITAPACPGTVATNIVPACTGCNSSKHNTDPEQWLIRKFGKRKAKAKLAEIATYFEWVKVQGAN